MNLYDLNLPDSLKDKLDAVERQLKRTETVVALCGGLVALLVMYLILFGLDRVFDTPAVLRHALALGGAVLTGLFLFTWMRHWVFARRTPRDMAKLVQRRHRVLGDRLLGVVELAEGDNAIDGTGASPELVQAAINQVAREAETMEFTESVSKRGSLGWGAAFAALALLVLGLFITVPSAAKNAFARMFNPTEERFTFTSVHDLPEQIIVPRGEPIRLKIGLTADSEREPDFATALIPDQPKIFATVENATAAFEIPEQLQPIALKVKIGDDRTTTELVPTERPTLGELTANIAYPAYLERPQQTIIVPGGKVEILEGASFLLKGALTPDREDDGTMVPRGIESAQIAVRPERGVVEKWDGLKIEKSRFETDEFTPDQLVGKRIEFNWTDDNKLAAENPYVVQVRTKKDGVPTITIDGIQNPMAILEEEVLELEITATDDFGLRDLVVDYYSFHDPESSGIEASFGNEILAEGAPTATILPANGSAATYSWSPLVEGVPEGSAIKIVAKTSDYYPGRGEVSSLVYDVFVLNRAQHAALLREKMEGLQAELEEVARDEEQLIEENEELSENPEEAKPSKLAKQEFAERAQAERMKRMAEDAKDIVKEAMKNPDIDPKTMSEWSEMSEDMKNLSEEELKEASESMKQAGQSKSDQEKKEKIDEAIAQQKDALEKMREMEKKANKSITNMVAQNFVNRLKQRAKEEKEIGQRLKTLALSGNAGANAEDLDDDVRDVLEVQGAKQLMTRKRANYIDADLQGFYNRTKEEVYKEIFEEMAELDMSDKLEEIADWTANNKLYKALGMMPTGNSLKFWEDKFTEWAGKIDEATKNQDQPPQDGDQQEMEEELLEILYSLLRAQGREEAIRKNTRLLEEALDESLEDE